MKKYFKRLSLLLIIAISIATAAFAVTDEIVRVAERADKLYVEQRYNEAFPLMKQAAEGGDVISMFNLATMYYEGQGTAQNIGQARYWWQQAANKGDDLAKEMLILLQFNMEDITKKIESDAFIVFRLKDGTVLGYNKDKCRYFVIYSPSKGGEGATDIGFCGENNRTLRMRTSDGHIVYDLNTGKSELID